jgi:hypothetical protein
MHKAIVLGLATALGTLLLVGCTSIEETAPVGAMVRPLEPIDMYESPHPSATVIGVIPPENECEVLDGPRTAEDITFWKISCPHATNPFTETQGSIIGWVEFEKLEVLD